MLEFPPGTQLINVNTREHYRTRAKITAALRVMARDLAHCAGIPRMERVKVRAAYFPPDRRKRDSSNVLFLSVKAGIDGLVDAGVLPDDNDKIVRSLELVPGEQIIKGGQMIIEITDDDS